MENKKREMEISRLMSTPQDHPPMIQIFVFKGEEYLGWDCFCKDEISIGSGQDVDLKLGDATINDIHSVLSVENGRINVSMKKSDPYDPYYFPTENEQKAMSIGPLDSLVIGPYTLKVKMNKNGKRFNDPLESLKESTENNVCTDPGPARIREEVQPSCDENQDHVQIHGVPSDMDTIQAGAGMDMDVPKDSTDRYNLVFEGLIRDDVTLEEVKNNLKLLSKKDDTYIERLFSGKKAILKRNADYKAVFELQSMFENTGALSSIEPCSEHGLSIHKDTEPEPHETEKAQAHDTPSNESINTLRRKEATEPDRYDTADNKSGTKTSVIDDDEDDDDEDEGQATFSLKDKIKGLSTTSSLGKYPVAGKEILLEVVKSRGDSIIDVRYLRSQEKYLIQKEHGIFCLAENRGRGEILLYLEDQITGDVKASEKGHERTYDRGSLSERGERVHPRRLSAQEEVVIHDGAYEYLIRQTTPVESPQVKETPKKNKEYARHFGRSVVFHVILLVILGMMPTYKPEPVSHDKDRFVQVDTKQLDEINKKTEPAELPKKAPEIIKMKEDQVVQRIDKRQAIPTSAEHRLVATQGASTRVASARSSGSGGGSGGGNGPGSGSGGGGTGPGNVVNKNINQAGILSMLGDSIGIKPTEAMAAVTNLDAVNSPAEAKAQFKVGGIVGKLGGGRIEIPKAGIVSTKGSSQVLRSGSGTGTGIGGSGASGGSGGEVRVAALEKGSTGTHQVKAKVSAQLNKTVKVQGGGMSREEVKKIIDQHLDEITRCYETALVANPSLMGRVVFEWKILMSGKVGEVKIKSSTLNSTDIHSCIQSSIKLWEFPQPDGSEVIVSYPFIFDIVGF